MREAKPLIDEIGASVVGVAAKEAHQAQKLIDDGMPFSLLLDPDDALRTEIGTAGRFSWLHVLHPSGVMPYLRAMRSSGRFFSLTLSQATAYPGVVVLDAQQNITWRHDGRHLGDYPTVDEVLTEARRAL